jgi:L-erythro-3,5-diaminohexanoate dehydrogenase
MDEENITTVTPRPVAAGGDALGTHRALDPPGSLPQPARRVDNDFTRLFAGEILVSVDTLNIDAASFAQMEGAAVERVGASGNIADEVAHMVLRTAATRGKQHNPATGSGGMLLGRILQIVPGYGAGRDALQVGDRIATLASLSLTPLRIDRVRGVRRSSAQIDVDGEAVLFATGPCAKMPDDLPERLALAVLDVAGAAPQIARLVRPNDIVVVVGAAGKSGILCLAEARRCGGAGACIVGVESNTTAIVELGELGLCDAIVAADARDAVRVRRMVLDATGGKEADLVVSCVNVPGAEMAAILLARDRGLVYFFAMSTSFNAAALGAEGVGKDIELRIGNGFARGHVEHTLAMLRGMPAVRALFERRYA